MNRLLLTLALLAALMASACSSGSSANANMAQSLPVPDTTTIVQTGDVRIGPFDMLQIRVFGVDELDGDYQVDHLGRMKMPLIGEVEAKGLTAFELASNLERRLEDNYLQDADVSVTIEEKLREQVTVEGSVNNPGIFPVKGEIGLLQAVALAGGTSDLANPRKVVIFRQVEGQRVVAGYDLTAIRRGEADDPRVFGNDIIVVDGSEARRTYGDFLRAVPLLGLLIL
ncbi:polysaccharide biosynthesis/export family protein [Henriciella algicola]|uniref:Polysaccharide export protein n=1 Tax=Henriciella algicola TaxID=1608422 RepID=A0A399RHD8_9PROT|nr:polysaccharide biosynthesis/export family protein [Henriciella algicola]RIJ29202.1 polysaccharide export protein [Henriciella algicola]